MIKTYCKVVLMIAATVLLSACGGAPKKTEVGVGGTPGPADKLLAQFVPVDIGVDEAMIKEEHRRLLPALVEVGRHMDSLFRSQVAVDYAAWRAEMAGSPEGLKLLPYFDQMAGPWDRLNHDKPFWGTKEKPKGVTYYPENMSKEEFEAFLKAHPEHKEAFTGYFTVIRRSPDNSQDLVAVPYSEEYRDYLVPASQAMQKAAQHAVDERLQKYLAARAEAFTTDNYRPSDMDWMDLGDGDLEVVIGPYEVYEDQLFGYKAAFQAIIALRNPEETAELEQLKALLPAMEEFLPIDDQYKNKNRGTESPLTVVDVLWTGGDIRAGIHTLAFNLPNDEVVREQKGSKKVMFKNVAQAKYNKILLPIADQLMTKEQRDKVTFNAFFNHTLVHEIAHGLGPGKLTLERDGKQVQTSVNAELKELYSVIEEAKADVLGTYLNYMLIEQGLRPAAFEEQTYASLLGGFFRSMRFGANEAHGKANVIQLNYLMEKGAVRTDNGKYIYEAAKMKDAVRALAHDILMIEANGDYAAAKAFIAKYGNLPADLQAQLAALGDVPVDLNAHYTLEDQMQGWN